MKCPKCGFENVDNAIYCISCGARIDNKIRCPKCGELISPDEVNCPKCGHQIPHEGQTGSAKKRNEKVRPIFFKIFSVASIVLFAIAIIASLGFYLDIEPAKETSFWEGSAIQYLILNWIDYAKNRASLPKGYISYLIICFLIVLVNISVVVTASIFGIIQTVKNLHSGKYRYFRYLIIVMFSLLISTTLLYSLQSFNYVETASMKTISNVSTSNMMNATFTQFAIIILGMFISESIFKFDKNQKSLFVTRLLLISIFIFGCLIFLNMATPFLTVRTNSYRMSVGLGYWFFDAIFEFNVLTASSSGIAIFVLTIILCVLRMLIVMLVAYIVIMVGEHYFNDAFKRHSYYIPVYSVALTLIIVNMLALMVNIALHCLFISIGNEAAYTSNYFLYVLIAVFVGFPFATTSLIRSINKHEKLAKLTTNMEEINDGQN